MSSSTRRFVLIGNANSRGVEEWQIALKSRNLPPAILVQYADLLTGRVVLSEIVQSGDVVRLESPGRDWEVEKLLLQMGAVLGAEDEAESSTRTCLPASVVQKLDFEKGRIWASRQWYLGWRELLHRIENQLQQCAPHRLLSSPRDIALMFDKHLCHSTLRAANVAVPRAFGTPGNYEELRLLMEMFDCRRVFIKLAHGSSASGIIAFRTDNRRFQAVTTTEVMQSGGEMRLYNSRRIRVLRDERDIQTLVDALCRHRVHVEEWLPKAGIDGQVFDLRVVVIAGRARHKMLRMSRTPMTNLHLLNARGDVEKARARMTTAQWESAMQSCESAHACLQGSFSSGIDLMWTPDFKRHAILEMNAFGNLLPRVLDCGLQTHEAELEALQEESSC